MTDIGLETVLAAVRQHGAELGAYEELGAIKATLHPNGDLLIFNYTQFAQFAGTWSPVERVCRGLIIHWPTATVRARAYDKFFNLSQMPESQYFALPTGPMEVTEKVDGCFLYNTPLNLWGGGTILIGEVVRDKLHPILIGMNNQGQLVPCEVICHFDNGTKDHWLAVTLS